MKFIFLLSIISLSAFAGTTKIRVCPFWWYRTDLQAWICDARPQWIEVVTPAESEEPKDQKTSTEPEKDIPSEERHG